MSTTDFPGGADPGPPAVGAYVVGDERNARQIVRALSLYERYHTLADDIDPDAVAYLTVFDYPPGDYCPHYVKAGNSPRGYVGPASCRRLVFDIDREGDLPAALADARTLLRFLLQRYPHAEDGVGAYFSGSKGFHLSLDLLAGYSPAPTVPAVCKRLALAIADRAGVRIDASVYDHQRLFRLPNSRHAKTRLYKRFLMHDELLTLDAERIRELARHPAGYAVPTVGDVIPELDNDFAEAEKALTADHWKRTATPSPAACPVVPKFVRDFIAWQDIAGESRHLTLFRCAAVLAEAGTPDPVIVGLLLEPAMKTGLSEADARRQIQCGAEHGRKTAKGVTA